MPLKDYLQQKGVKTSATPASGALSDYLKSNGYTPPQSTDIKRSSTTPAQAKKEPQKKENTSLWRFLGKQLMKPVGVGAEALETASNVGGSLVLPLSKKYTLKQGLESAGKELLEGAKDIKDVVTGEKETSFSQKLKEDKASMNKALNREPTAFEKFSDEVIGIGGDFVLDPLNKLKPVKLAKQIGKVTKLDKAASAGAKVLKETEAFKKARSIFSNTTGDKAFDEVVGKFRNLYQYREGQLIDKASKLQKDIKALSKGNKKIEETITEGLENRNSLFNIPKTVNKTIREAADNEKDYILKKLTDFKSSNKAIPVLNVVEDWLKLADKNKLNADDLYEISKFLEEKGVKLDFSGKVPKVGQEVINIVDDLRKTYKDFLDASRKVGLKVGEIAEYAPHIRTKESFVNKAKETFGLGARVWGKAGVEKGRKLEGTIKELAEQGIDIFEKNPAIQLAKKGQTYVKAITSKQFADEVAKFASKDGIEVTNPLLKGMKFAPEQAKVIDNFYQGIKPDELKVIIKGFDKIQNWWKAQALVAPSYHIRNIAGNLWNNFLADVNPADYLKAAQLQRRPELNSKLIEAAKKYGVLDEGWYAKDIGEEVLDRVGRGAKSVAKGLNPLSQSNYLFRGNKAVGSTIENNARLAHFISQIQKGMSFDDAAKSVKKFLFDYGNLSATEKNVFKRVIPFYTWTRKNLPLQLGELMQQPAKYVLPYKIVDRLEAGVEKPDERYMSEYLKGNIPIRIRKDKEGNTEYFLLGQWLPFASAIDLLSQPMDNLLGMVTPLVKTPLERFSNKSTYFKNTLGEYQPIEREDMEQGEFLGMSLRKKNINLLRNIRILSDLNKWYEKTDKTDVKESVMVKLLNTLFGKAATYDVQKAKYFYRRDTEDKVNAYKQAIKDAQKKGYKEKAAQLRKEMIEFQKSRKLQ